MKMTLKTTGEKKYNQCDKCRTIYGSNLIVCPYKKDPQLFDGKRMAITYPCLVKFFSDVDEAQRTLVTQKFYATCPDCGRVKMNRAMSGREIIREGHIACICSDGHSFNEKFLFSVFEQAGVDFDFHWSPDFLKNFNNKGQPCSYDFFLPKYNMIVEADGGLGHGKKTFKGLPDIEGKQRDEKKDKAARKQGYKVIRIDMETYDINELKELVVKGLEGIVKSSQIDWLKAYENGLTTLVKKVCREYALSPTIIRELAQKYKLSLATVRHYLEQGAMVGWCNYNTEALDGLYRMKNAERARQQFSKEVYMWDIKGKYYGVFSSAKEIENLSEKLVGKKLYARKISGVCNGDTTNHRSFVFSCSPVYPFSSQSNKYKKYRRGVIQYSLEGKKIKEFSCANEAEKSLGLPKDSSRNIIKCARGERNYAYGYKWGYKENE